MTRKYSPEWKAEILLSTQHGPGKAQEMVDHRRVIGDSMKSLADFVAAHMIDMVGGMVPDGTKEVRSGFPLTAVHFSMLITRKKN